MSDISVVTFQDFATGANLKLWRQGFNSDFPFSLPIDINISVIAFNDPAAQNITSRELYYQGINTDFGTTPIRGMERYFLSTFRPPIYKSFKYNYQGCDLSGPLAVQSPPEPHRDPWLNLNRKRKYNPNPYLYFQSVTDSGNASFPIPAEANAWVIVFDDAATGARFRYNSVNFDLGFDEINEHEPPRFTPTAYSIFQKLWQNEAQEDTNTAPPPAVIETNTNFLGKFTGPPLSNWRFNYNTQASDESFPPLAEPHFIGKFTNPWKTSNLQFQYNTLTGDLSTIVTPPAPTTITTVSLNDVALTSLTTTDVLLTPVAQDPKFTSIALSYFPIEE